MSEPLACADPTNATEITTNTSSRFMAYSFWEWVEVVGIAPTAPPRACAGTHARANRRAQIKDHRLANNIAVAASACRLGGYATRNASAGDARVRAIRERIERIAARSHARAPTSKDNSSAGDHDALRAHVVAVCKITRNQYCLATAEGSGISAVRPRRTLCQAAALAIAAIQSSPSCVVGGGVRVATTPSPVSGVCIERSCHLPEPDATPRALRVAIPLGLDVIKHDATASARWQCVPHFARPQGSLQEQPDRPPPSA